MKQKKQTKQTIKQIKDPVEGLDIDRIEKECASSIAKTEEFISDKGWDNYINHCVDIIYFNFKNFGWSYGIEHKPVTRDEIEENIIQLIDSVRKEECQIETGRIAVDIVDDQLWIALTL